MQVICTLLSWLRESIGITWSGSDVTSLETERERIWRQFDTHRGSI